MVVVKFMRGDEDSSCLSFDKFPRIMNRILSELYPHPECEDKPGKSALAACSLDCRKWACFARELKFAHITYTSDTALGNHQENLTRFLCGFTSFVTCEPLLGCYVRYLDLRPTLPLNQVPLALDTRSFSALLGRMPRLQSLHLTGIRLGSPYHELIVSERTSLDILRIDFPPETSLAEITVQSILDLVMMFRRIRLLQLGPFTINPEDLGDHRNRTLPMPVVSEIVACAGPIPAVGKILAALSTQYLMGLHLNSAPLRERAALMELRKILHSQIGYYLRFLGFDLCVDDEEQGEVDAWRVKGVLELCPHVRAMRFDISAHHTKAVIPADAELRALEHFIEAISYIPLKATRIVLRLEALRSVTFDDQWLHQHRTVDLDLDAVLFRRFVFLGDGPFPLTIEHRWADHRPFDRHEKSNFARLFSGALQYSPYYHLYY